MNLAKVIEAGEKVIKEFQMRAMVIKGKFEEKALSFDSLILE